MILRNRQTHYDGWLIALLIVVNFLGCDGLLPTKKLRSSAPVSGKVLAGDQPVADAKVLFLPLNSSDGRYRYSFAKTNEQGRFTMRFESGVYGAYVGKHLVLISTREIAETSDPNRKTEDKLEHAETVSPKFNKASQLFIDVDSGGNSDVIFQVELEGETPRP